MTLPLYHALWIATALAVIAIASGFITRWLKLREFRRAQAEEALDALAGYSEWLAAQRRGTAFGGDRSPLAQVRRCQQAAFPEFAPAMAALLALHARLLDFLWRQQLLRTRDPEAWLESDHDAQFMLLWSEHREAVHALAERLRQRAGEPLMDAEPESVYPV
ncbi:hypothetical protein [Ramlibacter humi]|uniref:DUF2489 domain-containing protein n=1 Tax=Ramlibacter humi TaxID=2530451 RepID=A0A4Z0BHE8_9BURK|nr:hypothetical protein [Ramlibacter humi]TFY97687.1 hypothetical protein EZ216_18350 [Ramlibacter humi]